MGAVCEQLEQGEEEAEEEEAGEDEEAPVEHPEQVLHLEWFLLPQPLLGQEDSGQGRENGGGGGEENLEGCSLQFTSIEEVEVEGDGEDEQRGEEEEAPAKNQHAQGCRLKKKEKFGRKTYLTPP